MNPTGYIDELTHQCVTGWAADLDNLSASLSFGVFDSGQGCAVVRADVYRPGLEQELGRGATGRYAFRCYFPEPLSPYQGHKVTLRCREADFVLEAELPAAEPVAIPSSDPLYRVAACCSSSTKITHPVERRTVRPGPSDLRATFELFRFYRPEVGLRRLLDDAGASNMSPRQIYHAVHNRPPDVLEAALRCEDYDPAQRFIAALSSREFQELLASRLLHAFPEKRRLFFVHIPKTAGVDLAARAIGRYASFSTNLLDPVLTPTPEMLFLAIKHVVLEMAVSDTIFISGHTELGKYELWAGNGVRYQDAVFTVVRDPVEQIISQVNYVLTRIFSDEQPTPPDTAGWREEFGVKDIGLYDSPEQTQALARRILRNQDVVVPNVICRFLGGGRYDTAITRSVAHDLEVVELKQLDAWSERQWGPIKSERLNVSRKFLSLQDLSADDLSHTRSITEEDQRYYADVLAALKRTGGLSIKGNELLA